MTEVATGGEELRDGRIPVVAIGASAGGVTQLQVLLRALPEDSGAAFVVLLHLAPDQVSQLATLLGRATGMPVVAIEDGMALVADRVHVIPSGSLVAFSGQRLRLSPASTHLEITSIIDGFFRDLAAAYNGAAVGIVLSGSGSDGALGLKAIKAHGGLAMVQDPDRAEYDGMPRAAVRAAMVDFIRDTADLVEPLRNHLNFNFKAGSPDSKDVDAAVSDEALKAVLDILRAHQHYNFSSYKPSMLKRRIQRRMGINGLQDLSAYQQMLEDDDSECLRLSRDFLISVTDFFRDPDTYHALRDTVLDPLLKAHGPETPIRIWVPGCATGEEAYSIAMVAAEAIAARGRGHEFTVFASDIDHRALEYARHGLYPESIQADISESRLRSFFEKIDHHYRVRSSLRERVVFAVQNVLEDPPYSGLELLSCRNLLIYLSSKAQKQLMTTFHFALNTDGFLFLGHSETIGEQIDLFEPVVKEQRLYRRIGPDQRRRTPPAFAHYPQSRVVRDNRPAPAPEHRNNAEKIARDILLQEHVPAAVLINRKLEILCGYGPTQDYFALPFGPSSLGAIEMVRPDFRSPLRAATHRAVRDNERAEVSASVDGIAHALTITARPLHHPSSARGLVLVTFERHHHGVPVELQPAEDSTTEQQLAYELDTTRRELQSTIQALEASNEDLKGSNEEILSMNEELQSSNEELETSKEELQSVNEELSTVNTELEHKVAELETAHNDLNNLVAGTQVATLFLDHTLSIKRFTPTVQNLLSVISSDIGRPLRDITFKVDDPDLLDEAQQVLETLTPCTHQVQAQTGEWYLRRILPYRTRSDSIEGIIVTFTEITELMQMTLASRESARRLDMALGAINGGIWEIPLDAKTPEKLPDNIYLSPRFKGLLGYDEDQFPNSLHSWRERVLAADRGVLADPVSLQRSEARSGVNYRIRHRDGDIRWFSSHGRIVRDDSGRPTRWIGIDCDITERKQAATLTLQVESQLQVLADAMSVMLAFIDTTERVRFTNTAYNRWFGVAPADVAGRAVAEVLGERTHGELKASLDRALAGSAVSCTVTHRNSAGDERSLRISLVPQRVDDLTLGCFALMRDITSFGRRSSDRPERQANLIYLQRMATVGEMLSTLAHDYRQPLTAINTYAGAITRMVHAGKPAEETSAVLRKISDQVKHANDIVDTTRHFAGRHENRDNLCDLNDIVHQALALTEGLAKKSNLECRIELYSPLPSVRCNPVQIEQVIINLIINAIEAMEPVARDQRILRVSTTPADPEHIQLTVADSGEGIAKANFDSVFDAFYTSKLEGTGLGLSLARTIVENHGGRLWFESQPDQGATFYLTLPLASQAPEDAASTPEPA